MSFLTLKPCILTTESKCWCRLISLNRSQALTNRSSPLSRRWLSKASVWLWTRIMSMSSPSSRARYRHNLVMSMISAPSVKPQDISWRSSPAINPVVTIAPSSQAACLCALTSSSLRLPVVPPTSASARSLLIGPCRSQVCSEPATSSTGK